VKLPCLRNRKHTSLLISWEYPESAITAWIFELQNNYRCTIYSVYIRYLWVTQLPERTDLAFFACIKVGHFVNWYRWLWKHIFRLNQSHRKNTCRNFEKQEGNICTCTFRTTTRLFLSRRSISVSLATLY
jgi:hypothetical protein